MAVVSTKSFAYAILEASEGKTGKDLDAVLSNAVKILSDKHLLGKKEEVLQYLQDIVDQKEGVVRAHIESASKLSQKALDEIEQELKTRYKAKEIYLDVTENKKYLGGLRIQVGDEVIDLTLLEKTHQLQNYLITN
jgi:F0F1-type ATP synthase delta subunit